jgi:hypothetical protein
MLAAAHLLKFRLDSSITVGRSEDERGEERGKLERDFRDDDFR